MYDTSEHIATASAYGYGLYANKLDFYYKKKHCMNMLSSLYPVCPQNTLFDAVEFQRKYRKNPFELSDAYLTPFSNVCNRFPRNTWKQNTHKCNTDFF